MNRLRIFQMLNQSYFKCLSILGFIFLQCLVAYRLNGQITARGLAMGGAYTALARGVHAPQWNPANLGLPDNPKFSFTFISLGAGAKNNSFDWGMLEKYDGKHLTENEVEDILNHIPDAGLQLDAMASMRALSFSAGRMAVSFGAEAGSIVKMDKAFFELSMKGNEIDKTYRLNDSKGEGLGIGMTSLSMGFPLTVDFAESFAIGGTVHLLYAGAYTKTDRAALMFSTREYGFDLDAEYAQTYTYQGNMGFGLDVGAAAQWNDNLTVSCGLANVLGSVSWSGEIKQEVGFVRGDSLTVLGLSEDDDEEDAIQDSSWTLEGLPEFSTRIPVVLRFGVAYREGPVVMTADITKGFTDGPFFSSKPTVAVGTEWSGISWLPLRMGIVMGGRIGLGTSFGFGFRPGGFVLDIGMMNRGFLSADNSKGFILGVELGIELQKRDSDVVKVNDL